MNANQQSKTNSGKRLCAVWAKASEKVSRFYVGTLGDSATRGSGRDTVLDFT